MTPAPSGFRPDIEGLRAIAVLLVIAGHYAVPGFAGGFIGVDVFFVISGYLITGILVREREHTGRIALLPFYANRLRRLLPALATMLAIGCFVAYRLLPPSQLLAQSQAAAAAAILWISNIHFAFADVDYFAAEATSNAFLHTWSLGVEEQFYLLWPLLILLATFRRKDQALTKTLTILFSGLALVSFGACLWLAQRQPSLAFYMMPARAWQFAAGALTWLLTRQHALGQPAANRVGAAGGALLLVALAVVTPRVTYPSLLALLPTLGACALLWAGTTPDSRPHALLSLTPMQAIGRLSYAWYLWHWPVLVLGELLLPIRGNAGNTLLALAASGLAAFLTHRLIENPIRYGKARQWLPRWQIGLAISIMLLANSQLLRWQEDTQGKQVTQTTDSIYTRAASDIPMIYGDGCDDWYKSDALKACAYGKPDAPTTAVLFGDSIGAQWFPTLTAMLDPEQWRIVVLTKSSCPMVDEPYFYQRIGREYTECANWRNKAIAWLQTQKIDRLFMGSTASAAFTDQQWQEGTQRILDKLAPKIPAIYLIEANPTLGFNGPDCLRQYQAAAPQQCAHGRADNSHYRHVAELLKQVTQNHPTTHWLETSNLVCPGGQCQALRDGTVIFRDSQHLTATFVAQAAPYFLRQVQQYEQATR
jgi:peptidoglycan/LPS O-acetylase OafA/YrhL